MTSTPPPVDTSKELSSLRTALMWVVLGLVAVCTLIIALVSARTGVYAMSGLIGLIGCARLVLPGAPFGISARSRLFDVAWCWGIAGSLAFLATSSSAMQSL